MNYRFRIPFISRSWAIRGGVLLILIVIGLVSLLAQYNVQLARDRVDAVTEYAKILRNEAIALRNELDTANRRILKAETLTNCNAELEKQPSQAFLTFVELDRGVPSTYISLARVLIESICEFSARPVLVYGVTTDPNGVFALALQNMTDGFSGRAILRYIKPSPHSLFFSKIKAVIASGVECGIYIDADAVVNYRVDDLWTVCQQKRFSSYPLLVAHNNDPNNQAYEPIKGLKSAPYAWAASFIWTASSLPFLIDVYERCVQNEFTRANFDETALNILAWERQITEQACTYMTYPRAGELEQWYMNQTWPQQARYTVHDLVAFHISSGGKNWIKSKSLLELYKDGAKRGLKVYYNQRSGKWMDFYEAGICVVNSKNLEESRAKATMLHHWSNYNWEERRDCCKNDPAYSKANLP